MVPLADVSADIDAFHRETMVVDLHTHALLTASYLGRDMGRRHRPPRGFNPLKNAVDLPRAIEGGVNVLVYTAYLPFAFPFALAPDRAYERVFDIFDRFVLSHPDRVGHARSVAEAEAIAAGGRLAAILAVEGGHALAGHLDNIARFARRGVAYITLTHFVDNGLAAAAFQPLHRRDGLTRLGRDAVREMNRCGVVVDASHCSDRAFREVADACQGPFFATHNGVRALCPTPRNISDEQIDLVARAGGVVGVMTFPWFLARRLRGGLDLMVGAIRHVADRAGVEHVGIGSDMDGFTWNVRGLRDIACLPRLTGALLEGGFSRDEVRKILGGNALRVLREAWGREVGPGGP